MSLEEKQNKIKTLEKKDRIAIYEKNISKSS